MAITPRLVGIGAALLLGVGLVSCGKQSEDASISGGTIGIRGSGSTFVAPLMDQWIAEYRKSHPELAISYDGVGSGTGIEQFITGKVDFAATDAPMKPSEAAQVDGGVKHIPVTAGEVVLSYNLPWLEGELRLPSDVYADIFLGKIYRWDDPRIAAANPDLTLQPKLIQVIGRLDSSGTTYTFTNHLSAISTEWRERFGAHKRLDWPGGAMRVNYNLGMAQRIKVTLNSIGYLEYGFARRLGLPMATLQNAAGAYVPPDARGGKAALYAAAARDLPTDLQLMLPNPPGQDAYPIVALTWVLLRDRYDDADKGEVLVNALNWVLGPEGQTEAEELGYIPLPDPLVKAAIQQLSENQ